MNAKTIFIHIGLEKTGTTSIQNFLFNNAEQLKQKYIFYSTMLDKDQRSLSIYSGQSKYIRGLVSKDKEIKIKKELPQTIKSIIDKFEKSNCTNLVFSNEHLSSRLKDTNDLKNLKELFKPYNYPIKIVIYVRNQVDLLESLYFEFIKSGGKDSLSNWSKDFTFIEIDFNKLLKEWGSVFGNESIIVSLFDRKNLKNGDIIDDFLDLLLVQSDEKFIRSNNQNLSLGYKSIEFMRIYNSHINEPERKPYILNNLLSMYGNDKEKISLSHDDRIRLFNKYSTSNHEFVKKYLPEISYDFFIQTSRNPNKQNFSEDVLWDIINHLIHKLDNIDTQQKQTIEQNNSKINTLINNRWYRLGQMSRKKKIWTIGKVVSKKIKLYWVLQLLAKFIKNLLGK